MGVCGSSTKNKTSEPTKNTQPTLQDPSHVPINAGNDRPDKNNDKNENELAFILLILIIE